MTEIAAAIDWSPQQLEAIDKVNAWLADPDRSPVFRMFGFAGTGKTTLAKELARSVARSCFAAYTGKAASVMKRKGCWDASTIHSLIYKPLEKGVQRLNELKLELMSLQSSNSAPEAIRAKELQIEDEEAKLHKPEFNMNYESDFGNMKLAVIDEVSMVGGQMAHDLLDFGVPILALGDPAQLPPIEGEGYFTDCVTPDVMLTEIHRQALENPILYLATRVRTMGNAPNALIVGDWGEAVVKVRATDDDFMAADQILAGTNRTRKGINQRVRNLLGRCDPLPQVGDKIVCLRNNRENGLLNGTLHEVIEVSQEEARKNNILRMRVRDEDGIERTTKSWQNSFLDQPRASYEQYRWYDDFDFGYCLTVHKSQGSQWDNVVLVDEAGVFKEEAWRWRYTGITRAAKTLTIVKG